MALLLLKRKFDPLCVFAIPVKKGYHKTSLAVHPDRVGPAEKEVATKKFQTLGKIYTILSDKNKRAVYDETGRYCILIFITVALAALTI